jgi:hypothetical protein
LGHVQHVVELDIRAFFIVARRMLGQIHGAPVAGLTSATLCCNKGGTPLHSFGRISSNEVGFARKLVYLVCKSKAVLAVYPARS